MKMFFPISDYFYGEALAVSLKSLGSKDFLSMLSALGVI